MLEFFFNYRFTYVTWCNSEVSIAFFGTRGSSEFCVNGASVNLSASFP